MANVAEAPSVIPATAPAVGAAGAVLPEPTASGAKKRGRKPREKTYNIMAEPDLTEEVEHIILHMTLDAAAEAASSQFDEILAYNPTLREPEPYEPHGSTAGSAFADRLRPENPRGREEDGNPPVGSYLELAAGASRPNTYEDKRTNRVVHDLLRYLDGSDYPASTDAKCWWCCEQFAGPPCGIPLKLVADKFHVHGLFCNYSCACAYLFNESDLRDQLWSTFTLLNLAFKRSVRRAEPCPDDGPAGFSKVRMAPPRQALASFGGYMSIDQFRKAGQLSKTYKLVLPPMTLIIPQIEEAPQATGIIPVNRQRMNFAAQSLKKHEATNAEKTRHTLGNYMTIRKVSV
jgi:hypothetical protein